jgi:hypothetical protein
MIHISSGGFVYTSNALHHSNGAQQSRCDLRLCSCRFSDIGTGTWRDVAYAILVSMATPAGKCLPCHECAAAVKHTVSSTSHLAYILWRSLCALSLRIGEVYICPWVAAFGRHVGRQLLQRHAPGELSAAAQQPLTGSRQARVTSSQLS